MLGPEPTLVFRRDPSAAMFGLTGSTSAAGVSAETVETLTAHEPLHLAVERLSLVERFRRTAAPVVSVFSSGAILAESTLPLWVGPPPMDPLVARIAERRRRLLRERGLFTDSVGMIRELRDVGP